MTEYYYKNHQNSCVAKGYCIEVMADDEINNAIGIEWHRELHRCQKDRH